MTEAAVTADSSAYTKNSFQNSRDDNTALLSVRGRYNAAKT